MVLKMIPWRLSLGACREEEGQEWEKGKDYRFGKMKEGVRDLEIRWYLPQLYEKSSLEGKVRDRLEELQLDSGSRRGRCSVWIRRRSERMTWFEVNEIEALSRVQGFEEIVVRITGPNGVSIGMLKRVVARLRPRLDEAWGECDQWQEANGILLCYRPTADGVKAKAWTARTEVVWAG